MNCNVARERLTAAPSAPPAPELERHLDQCPSCRTYAARLGTAAEILRDHHGNVEPDAAFAARVASQLREEGAETLGWAALRLIPVTLALLLALGWFALSAEPQATTAEVAAPTDDVVSWMMELAEEQR